MSAKANPTWIGAFVVGAIVLFVGSLVAFGTGKFLDTKYTFVSYFEGSLAGLAVGSPVTFRGVPIGAVTNIQAQLNVQTLTAKIPVFFEVSPGSFTLEGTGAAPDESAEAVYERARKLIDKGLRAELVSQSLVTGKLAIQLNFQPGTKVRLVGAPPGVVEIPTVPSAVQMLFGELQGLDLNQLVKASTKLVKDLDAVLASKDAKEIAPELKALIEDARVFMATLDIEMVPTLQSVRGAANSAEAAFDVTKTTLANVDRQLQPAIVDARRLVRQLEAQVPKSLARLDSALATAQQALDGVDNAIRSDSATMKDLRRALVEFAAASRAVRNLADELERNPSVIIRGK